MKKGPYSFLWLLSVLGMLSPGRLAASIEHDAQIPQLAFAAQELTDAVEGAGPLPEFTFKGVALHPDHLSWAPTGELEHPSVVKMEGRVRKSLGRYYLYYAPHKHIGIGMAYSDSIEGPWKEYQGNPVLEGPAAPDVRWIEELSSRDA